MSSGMAQDIAKRIRASIHESLDLHGRLQDLVPSIEKAARIMTDALKKGGKVMFAGNGGSAADAQHMAAEFVNRFARKRSPMAGLALTTDTSVLTSIGNDSSFVDIFSRQVEALGKKGDVLVGITTSGTSPNITRSIAQASRMGIMTIAITGAAGLAGAEADCVIQVPSQCTPRIQEVHLLVEHILCEIVESSLFGSI